MSKLLKRDPDKLHKRQAREDLNIFSRLPTVYAASRMQGQQLLQIGGGLSIMEWRILWDLSEVGPMTISELASLQHADHSLLSRALPDIRKKGYVDVERDPDDGRQTIVILTDKGHEAFKTAAPIMARRRQALREEFSEDELKEFIGHLDRLEDFLRQPIEKILQKDAAE